MKKCILAVLLPLLYFIYSLFAPPLSKTPVRAESETYACICTETAYFYPTKNVNSGLFLLPQTYFVKVLSVEGDFCKVEYSTDSEYTKKLTGYARTNDLTFVDFQPVQPYLYHVFEVNYTIDGSTPSGDTFLDKITLSCAYYGDYKIGTKTYCYVLRDGSFGYIPKPDNLHYFENTEYADYLASLSTNPPITQDTQKESEGMSAAQIAILITLCILVPLIAALVLKAPRKSDYTMEE